MNLSQSYDSGHKFNIFTWVDLGYFLELIFLIDFFISSFDIELVENWASWFFFFNLLFMKLSKFFNSSYRSVGWPDFAPFLPFFNWASYFFYLLSMELSWSDDSSWLDLFFCYFLIEYIFLNFTIQQLNNFFFQFQLSVSVYFGIEFRNFISIFFSWSCSSLIDLFFFLISTFNIVFVGNGALRLF